MNCACAPLCSLPFQFALPHPTVRVLHGRISMKTFTRLTSSDEDAAFARLVEANPNIMNEEWQKERRKETEELRKKRELEAEEEAVKTENYRQISKRMEGFAEEEIKEAKALVASFIMAGEDIEEKIQEATENGKLNKLVLLVIYNRLELARYDDQKHIVQALDLLFRRIEAEMLRKESSPAMQFLDELLNLHDGTNHEDWLRKCRQTMMKTFPREDAFSFLAPQGFDLQSHQGPIDMPIEEDLLLRVDFLRETNAFLAEILAARPKEETVEGMDPQSVAILLSQQQKENAIQQVRDLLKLAVELKW